MGNTYTIEPPDTQASSGYSIEPPDKVSAPAPSMLDSLKSGAEKFVSTIPGVGLVHRVAGAVQDFANQNMSPDNPHMLSPAATFGTGVVRDVAGLVKGATSPEGIATTGATIAAPEIMGPALVAHGVYNLYKGWGDLKNPDVLQNELSSAAEATGGAAVTAGTLKAGGGPVTQAVKRKIAEAAPDKALSQLQSAIPPMKSSPYTPEDLQAARSYLEVEHGSSPIKTPSDVVDAADSAIGKIEDHVGKLIQANPTDQITSNPLADVRGALSGSVRKGFVTEGLKELQDYGLDKPLTVQDADDIRWQLNQDNKAVLKRNNYDVATARATDPGFAAREAAAESLRDGIYGKLAERGIPDAQELRLDEGSLIKIRNAAQNQVLNADKAVSGTGAAGPLGRTVRGITRMAGAAGGAYLAGPAGAVGGSAVGDLAGDVIAPSNLTRSELIEKSFKTKAAEPPQYPAIPTRPPIRGLLTAGPLVTPPTTSESSVTAVEPERTLQRNPNSGRIQRIYSGQIGVQNSLPDLHPPPNAMVPAASRSTLAEGEVRTAGQLRKVLEDPNATAIQKAMAKAQLNGNSRLVLPLRELLPANKR